MLIQDIYARSAIFEGRFFEHEVAKILTRTI